MTSLPLTCAAAAEALRAGEMSSVELVGAALERADALDPQLGVYLARFDEDALARAARADRDFAAGIDRGPLQGIPIGLKDNLAVAEGPTTAQSIVLGPRWDGGADGAVAARLKRAGAVITGKLSLMELAFGLPDADSPFPLARNPWDPERWTGGSSSGSAAGVAAGLVLAAIGTDTGGSIRGPAAYCGVSGLAPTFGRVPLTGSVPLGYSLDRIGPLARSARDCALVLSAMTGPEPGDPWSVDGGPMAWRWPDALDGIRIGVDRPHHFEDGDDPAVRDVFESALDVLVDLGATVHEVELPHYTVAATASMVTACCDGFLSQRGTLIERWEDYGIATRELFALGAAFGAGDYVQAQRVRRAAQRALAGLFEDIDVVVGPTSTTAAPRLEDVLGGGAGSWETLRRVHTPYWSGVGAPALSVPMGFNAEGLPLGLQLAGAPFGEALLVAMADAYQRQTDWHLRVAPLAQAPVGGG